VWGDHLLPLLTCKDAARLGCTCKVLRAVVREHHAGDLREIDLDELQAALTTFPRARNVTVDREEWEDGDAEALVQWLREGGRGRHLAIVRSQGEAAHDLVYRALRAGALPSLKGVDFDLSYEAARALLSEGFLHAIQELCVVVNSAGLFELPAFGLVRQLPALIRLEVSPYCDGDDPIEWPPFIPPSLKALLIDDAHQPAERLMLRALPGMLGSSGARLDSLEILFPHDLEDIGDGLVHVAQALRCCSPTLKYFRLMTQPRKVIRIKEGQEARLRLQWADVLAGVSACRELQVLVLPNIEVEPLFPPGTAFGRLTNLEISDYEREQPPDADVMGLWEVMASGGLPVLAKLKVRLEGRWGSAEEVRIRVAPALESVAGTLTHLHLEKSGSKWSSDELEVGYELGVAVGKLRRLMDLSLKVSRDGLVHHAMAQGLAASGGERPSPLLWRVWLFSRLCTDADRVASLLLPSVRVFLPNCGDKREALLIACALRQAGYKHNLILDPGRILEDIVPAIAPSCVIRAVPAFELAILRAIFHSKGPKA
jgi:hypothetical protein